MKEFLKIILYKPLFNLLAFFAWLVPGHSVGWAIIMLTIIVRLILWAPTAKGLRSGLQLRLYQDEIKQIQERHKDDRTAQAQAVAAFYKEKGVNPLSSCLPLLIQLPILFILYKVFIVGLNESRPDLIYAFTPHLDVINTDFFGINLARAEPRLFGVFAFLPFLAAVLQYFQSRHSLQLNPGGAKGKDPASAMGRQMVYMFPVMTYIIGLSLPSGLSLYWATATAIAWLQQVIITRTFRGQKPAVAVTVRQKR